MTTRLSSARNSKVRNKASSKSSKLLRYFCATFLLIAGIVALKCGLAWASERYVYTLPILGGLLKSLELIEVTNVVIFAILGVGLGAFTLWLPRQWGLLPKVLPLVIAVPLVFMSGYAVRYHVWVQQVAVQSELLPTQAQRVTNALLEQATGNQGVVGFFRYTIQVPILPTDLRALQSIDEDDKWFRSELTRFSGLEPGLFSMVFKLTGWGIRLFYTLLATVTAVIYFAKGIVWANQNRQPLPQLTGK
ncbi:hypothetical protein PN498_20935 [Oscillatoria sp. CS-180]|uniref:hypothetical protein n=1 Tax=Oscillatoria sp. CS-180 TaxID=3021720 RepID=UPI0023305992|nr:hypothetical protein [Oscillatoria sp. CS-180]MDB9528470.1 hypothetical protein [Oscillatoria sp. CS-180]